MVGKKTTKLTRTMAENDRLGRLLKSPIFIVQKAFVPKKGVEFHQKSIGVIIRISSSYIVRRRETLCDGA